MIKKIIFIVFCLSIITHSTIISQEIDTVKSKKIFLITKSDGGEFIGEIISDDGRELLLLTTNIGKIYINKSDISNITAVDEDINNKIGGEYRSEGPFTTRYFFTNNSLPIKKNEHYAMIQLYGPEIHFSVTDKLSLGIMASWIGSPIALASKLCLYSKNNTHISLGNILGNSGYLYQGNVFGGLHWLTITKGDRLKNFSFSAGYGYILDKKNNILGDLGQSSFYQSYSPNEKYYIPRNGSVDDHYKFWALENKLISEGYSPFGQIAYKRIEGAYILSFAGIVPVGKKASFIFDSMLFLNQKNGVLQYEDHDLTVEWEYTDYISGTEVTVEGAGTYTVGVNGKAGKKENIFNTTLLFMPSFRINKSYDKAFQISLAGVITKDNSFPIPTVSWLRKF